MYINSYISLFTITLAAEKECARPNTACNCDLNDGISRQDSGAIREKEQLPITAIYSISDYENWTTKSKMTVSLGDLKCYKQGMK